VILLVHIIVTQRDITLRCYNITLRLYRSADKSLARPTSRCIFLMVRIFLLMLFLLLLLYIFIYIY